MNNDIQKHQFVFHLNTEQKSLALKEFTDIAKSLEITTNSVLKIFSENNQSNIFIDIPENGSYKILCGIAIFLAGCFGSEIANGIFDRLVGKDIRTISKEFTKEVVSIVQGIYRTPSAQLKEISVKMPSDKQIMFDKIIKSQSDFYKAIYNNESVKSVGFSHSKKDDDKRNEFILHISKDIERELPPEKIFKKLTIYKSVNVKKDAKWVFIDHLDKKNISAYITDESFKHKFMSGNSPLKQAQEDDEIIALVQYNKKMTNGEEKINSIEIKEIYKFNNQELKAMPEDIQENFVYVDSNNNSQGSLF